MTTDTQLAPTDAEIAALYAEQTGFILDDSPAALLDFARAVLARWGQPAHSGEPVYAFRRKGLDDFCTCTEKRYAELSAKPNLFETRIFYTAPQPVEREPLTPERVKEIVLDAGYDQCDIPDSERAAFIDGLRHGEEAHGIKAGRARLEQPCA